ncbi:hypothetical protein CSC70_03885 [Pseudoxanthomonas kalamensis DSM 18571]|nr:hypothetical protein CSC70_03885 [Pseudoxanthomonas kalamensis DSM 18571]
MQRGTVDTDGVRHSAKVAWRALALLQKEIEAALVHVDESDFVAVGTAGRITGIRVRQDTGD